MDMMKAAQKLNRVPPGMMRRLERIMKMIPAVRREIDRQTESMLEGVGESLRPYKDELPARTRLPEQGLARGEVLALMRDLRGREEARWREGYVSGAVYHGDEEHIAFMNEVYAINSQANPLHFDLWPSAVKYEAEVIAMTGTMLGGGTPGAEQVCGSVSSGGTDSILLAMKAYRDRGREERGIRRPNIVIPVTAHAAFDKAGQYFNIEVRRIPFGPDHRADVNEARAAVNRNTVAVVGSACSFPHGVIDPIEELSELARARRTGFHTDCCLGGFVLPFAEKLGYKVPPFDFRLPGVTSISADTHKFGYAAKGTSVILYRDEALRRHQFYSIGDWPGGLYFSPTFAGSRPGALIAQAWASLVSVGEEGYLAATKAILETAAKIREGIKSIPGLRVLGDPLWVIAFDSAEVDIYRVLDAMAHRRWSLNGLHRPPCVHLCVTLRHTLPGVAERFIEDLKASVAHVRANPSEEGGFAPVYGLAATLPTTGVIGDLLKRYLDEIYKV